MSRDLAIAFDKSACRKDYEQAFAKLLVAMPRMPRRELAEHFIALEALLDDGMVEVKTAMLTEGLLSPRDYQLLGHWIYRQHHNLMRLGAKAVHACAADSKVDTARTMRLLALTFLHVGDSVKWELMAGRHYPRDYPALHGLMKLAIAKRRQGERGELVVDGMRREATLEQLYLRTLLLDRFASGPLTSEEIEVLDAWLWEWGDALRFEARHEGGLVMRADLDANGGLAFGPRNAPGVSLYLHLEPLEDLRRAVINELHRGHVVPHVGRAASMPIQAHVAVLLQLRKLFSGAGSPESPRAPRRGMLGDKMEVLVGAQEILAALGPRKPEARRLTPRNASATGYLFVTSDKATEDIAVGTLLGLRVDPREPPVLGRVVRRVHEVDDGWHLGVEVLSDPSVPIRAASLESDGGKSHDLVFVPGSDRSGRFDSFAVDYGLLGRHERYRLRAGAAVYSLAFNRVRRRGRDWALAGFEILEAATA